MPSLRKVIAKECVSPSCSRRGQRFAPHEGFCEGCGEPLAPVRGWNSPLIALASGGVLATVVVTCSLLYYVVHRPHPLTADLTRRITAWVKEADRDRLVTPAEQAELDELTRRNRLEPRVVAAFVAEVRAKREESRLSLERGHRLVAERRYDEARREFQSALDDDPENAMGWANLGLTDAVSGRDREALEAYNAALHIDPGNWLAHYNLGLYWARRGERELALSNLEDAFAAVPDPQSRERRSMVADLRVTGVPAELRREPRFRALLGASQEGRR
jgi:tetratricopeptide (TPR) repeat protein